MTPTPEFVHGLSSTHSSIQQILIECPSVAGSLLEVKVQLPSRMTRTLPTWSLSSREEREKPTRKQ